MDLKERLITDKGLTLVEILVTLAIASFISVIIFSNLFSGMNSFKSVNKEISLHDEANYIMTEFVNQIYVATSVTSNYPKKDTNDNIVNPCKFIISITKMNGDVMTLGFDKKEKDIYTNAVMNDENILPPNFSIVCQDPKYPSIYVDDSNNSVNIEMTIQDNDSGRQFELNNKVSFVKVQ